MSNTLSHVFQYLLKIDIFVGNIHESHVHFTKLRLSELVTIVTLILI